jgi:sulfite oxidase
MPGIRGRLKRNSKPGTYAVWSRSVDALGRSQPLDGKIYWNPNGYEWNGVHKIQVTVR